MGGPSLEDADCVGGGGGPNNGLLIGGRRWSSYKFSLLLTLCSFRTRYKFSMVVSGGWKHEYLTQAVQDEWIF